MQVLVLQNILVSRRLPRCHGVYKIFLQFVGARQRLIKGLSDMNMRFGVWLDNPEHQLLHLSNLLLCFALLGG